MCEKINVFNLIANCNPVKLAFDVINIKVHLFSFEEGTCKWVSRQVALNSLHPSAENTCRPEWAKVKIGLKEKFGQMDPVKESTLIF